jgi:DNA repair protein RadC
MSAETKSRKELWAMKVRELVPTYKFTESAPHSDRITSSRDAEMVLRPLFRDMIDESVWALYLNGGNDLIGVYQISEGSVSESAVSPAKVIRGAVLVNASVVILAHNHPSGHSTPSAADRVVTEDLAKACDLMRLPLMDHLIIGARDGYYSFADAGLIEEYRRRK